MKLKKLDLNAMMEVKIFIDVTIWGERPLTHFFLSCCILSGNLDISFFDLKQMFYYLPRSVILKSAF